MACNICIGCPGVRFTNEDFKFQMYIDLFELSNKLLDTFKVQQV